MHLQDLCGLSTHQDDDEESATLSSHLREYTMNENGKAHPDGRMGLTATGLIPRQTT